MIFFDKVNEQLGIDDFTIVGGCYASFVLGEPIRDFDTVVEKSRAHNLAERLARMHGIRYRPIKEVGDFWGLDFMGFRLAAEGVAFKRSCFLYRDTEVYPIDTDPATHIMQNFDFQHAMFLEDRYGEDVSRINHDDINLKILRLARGEECATPLGTFLRMDKFYDRGWRMPKEERLKLFVAMRRMSAADFEKQLVGFRGSQELLTQALEFLDGRSA